MAKRMPMVWTMLVRRRRPVPGGRPRWPRSPCIVPSRPFASMSAMQIVPSGSTSCIGAILFHSWPAPSERPTSQGGSAACPPPRRSGGLLLPPGPPLLARLPWRPNVSLQVSILGPGAVVSEPFVRRDPQSTERVETQEGLPAPEPSPYAEDLPSSPPEPASWTGLDWLLIIAITGVGGVLRFARLAYPNALVFDEVYYAKDACLYLGKGMTFCGTTQPTE